MRRRLPAIFLPLAAVVAACAGGCTARGKAVPRPAQVTRPAATAGAAIAAVRSAAELSLDEILPPAVLPSPATRPASATAPSAGKRPPLEALTLYAEACDNLLKHRRLAAVALLEKAVALDPDSFELHAALGRAYLGSGGSDERSIAELERAAGIDPDHVDLQADLGRQYLARGEDDKALWHLRLALNTSDYATNEADAAVAELFAGRALARAGYHAAAVEVYGRLLNRLQAPSFALRADPEVAYLLARPDLLRLQAAQSYEQVGRYEEALKAYDAAAARDPNDFVLRARAVRVLVAMGRHDDATARAAELVARFNGDAASVELLRDACRAAGQEGAVVEARQRLRRRRPRDPAVLYALADVLRSDGRAAEALDLLGKGETTRPRAEAVVRMYQCALDLDATGRAAARFLIAWSAQHPDAVHLLSHHWDDLVSPSRSPRVTLRTLKDLDVAGTGYDARASAKDRTLWEAARWFWVAQVARLRHRQDVAREAVRRAVGAGGGVIFAPAFRSASGVGAGAPGDDVDPDAVSGVAPVRPDELAARAAAAGDAALAAELRGLSLLGRKQYAAARAQLDEAAKLGGASPDLQFARAVAARGAGEDPQFEGLLWKLLSDWPGYDNAHEALYAYYAARGAYGPASRVLSEWLAADRSNVTARLLQAREDLRSGRAATGQRALEALVDERGDDPRVLAAARSYYAQAGKLEAFVAKLRQRHDARPAEVAPAAQAADVLAEQRRPAEAARVVDETRAAVADDADLLYEVAHLYDRIRQPAVTAQVLRDVLRLDPSHPAAANDLGYSLADDGGDLDEAESLTRRAVAAVPDNPSFLDSLGWVLYKRGRFGEAAQSLARAVEASQARGGDADAVVLDHLGDALYRAGDAAAAAERWKQALRHVAGSPGTALRDDLKALRLQLERKTKQTDAGQPVTVAPVGGPPEGPRRPGAVDVGASNTATQPAPAATSE